jgi:hypothetical protein
MLMAKSTPHPIDMESQEVRNSLSIVSHAIKNEEWGEVNKK